MLLLSFPFALVRVVCVQGNSFCSQVNANARIHLETQDSDCRCIDYDGLGTRYHLLLALKQTRLRDNAKNACGGGQDTGLKLTPKIVKT